MHSDVVSNFYRTLTCLESRSQNSCECLNVIPLILALIRMPPPAYIDEGGNIQSGGDVCDSVCL